MTDANERLLKTIMLRLQHIATDIALDLLSDAPEGMTVDDFCRVLAQRQDDTEAKIVTDRIDRHGRRLLGRE